MQSRQRVRAVMAGRGVDRVPVQYQFLGGAHQVLAAVGMSMDGAYRFAETIAATQIAAAEMFGHDAAMAPWGCLTVEQRLSGADWNTSRCGIRRCDPGPCWTPPISGASPGSVPG